MSHDILSRQVNDAYALDVILAPEEAGILAPEKKQGNKPQKKQGF